MLFVAKLRNGFVLKQGMQMSQFTFSCKVAKVVSAYLTKLLHVFSMEKEFVYYLSTVLLVS